MSQSKEKESKQDDNSSRKVNEKERGQESSSFQLSNVLHSSFGIDHYPNYLYRWRVNDISKLEQQLLSQLKEVQTKKKQLTQIFDLAKSFKGPLNIENKNQQQKAELLNGILHTKLLPYVQYDDEQNISLKWDWNMISSLMAEEMDDVYSFPLLDEKFCDLLLNHVDQYMKFMQNVNKINDNNNDGTKYLLDARRAVLDWMNLSWLNDFLLNEIVNPIVGYLFQKELFYNCYVGDKDKNKNKFTQTQRKLDWRHAYVIGYKSKKELHDDIYQDDNDEDEDKEDTEDKEEKKNTDSGISQVYQRSGLVCHTDDSEITLNCCLNDDFEGGALNIFNVRGKEYFAKEYEHLRYESELETEIKLKKGYGVIHRGRQLHSVSDVESGERAVLIMWCRNLNGLRKEICPCCWLNRRNDLNCVCGPLWN